jgi:hypothetical protein
MYIGAHMGETRRGAADWRQCVGGGGGRGSLGGCFHG